MSDSMKIEWSAIEFTEKKLLYPADRTVELLKAVEQAEKECGSCGCEFDPLYKRALKLLKSA